ncbi:hypothetical protein GCM10027425_12370 [Alteromonas gracilis]
MPFGRLDANHFLLGQVRPVAVGRVQWEKFNGQWRCNVIVRADGFRDGEVRVQLVVRPARPETPTIVLILKGAWQCRLDLNTPHRDCAGTHFHWRMAADEREEHRCVEPGEFPDVPEQIVDGRHYAELVDAFLDYLRVDAAAVDWVEPPFLLDGR